MKTFDVRADFGMSRVFANLNRKLKPFFQHRQAEFEFVFTPRLEHAEDLLKLGLCTFSVFGKWDPVDVYHRRAVLPVAQPRCVVIVQPLFMTY